MVIYISTSLQDKVILLLKAESLQTPRLIVKYRYSGLPERRSIEKALDLDREGARGWRFKKNIAPWSVSGLP